MLPSQCHTGGAALAAPNDVGLPNLLRQMARELESLQLMAANMETSVDDMIERHAEVLDARSMQNLQLLDIMNQTLAALSVFADVTASLASPHWVVDADAATSQLKLASLAHRLAKGVDREPGAAAQSDDYELFGD
jgi:hypothetical protein